MNFEVVLAVILNPLLHWPFCVDAFTYYIRTLACFGVTVKLYFVRLSLRTYQLSSPYTVIIAAVLLIARVFFSCLVDAVL